MTDMSRALLAAFAGFGLGLCFYGGLWWTIQRSVRSDTAKLWPLGSFLSRACLAVAGFYVVAQGDWRRWLACLSGFLVARIVLTRVTHLAASP